MPHILQFILLQFCFGACLAAEPPIYAYTETDGSVSLSNVPADARYAVLVGEPQPTTQADGGAAAGPAQSGQYNDLINRVAGRYGLESELLHAVIAVESGYDAAARSRKGAGGLMQLMPGTAKRYGVADAFDPEQNVDGGARYLRDLIRIFKGDLSLVLAAYNAGEYAVARNSNRIPQYRETLEYVPKVLAHYRRNQGRHTGNPFRQPSR
jgi:soluble lytic murein transglycosylase-like protein